ncbi:MAG: sodium:proton antiporter, partial [Mucinivorans sp.]
MFILMVTIFLLGILMVALEDKIGINKAASALLMAVVLWVAASVGADMDISSLFVEQLGETSETLFFVMGALVIIELVDT